MLATANASFPLSNLFNFDKQPIKYSNASLHTYSSRLAQTAIKNLKRLSSSKSSQYRDLISQYAFKDFSTRQLLDFDDFEIISLARTKSALVSKIQISITDWPSHYEFCKYLVQSYNLSMPAIPKNPNIEHIKQSCKRLTNELWWRRSLRTAQVRLIETESVRLGHVSRHTRQLYVSDEALNKRHFHKRRNERLLESIVAINEDGYERDLKELSDVNTSNPKIRRSELMARLKGLDEYAKTQNLVADFYTITCPSRMHRYSSVNRRLPNANNGNSFLNGRFDGTTPRQAQIYLNKQWSKIRAEFARKGVQLIGMRVAEPHHDGCPHWHILAFFPKPQRSLIRQIIRRYALEDSPTESGAQKHRFTAIKIKSKSKSGKKQSAVGYIAKYISKNLSLDDVNTNDILNDGQSAKQTVNRVEAWASVWGIRQFQQFGGERITPYRELRRLRGLELDDSNKAFHSLWVSADSGDYASYLKECSQRQKIKIERLYSHVNYKKFGSRHVRYDRVNQETGEVLSSNFTLDRQFSNQFGSLKLPPIIGLSIDDNFLTTRLHTWTTQARRLSRVRAAEPSGLGLVSITVPSNHLYH